MSVTYNDDTPDLVYSRDRLGRLVSVTRGNVTHAAYTYRADLQPDTETQQIDSLNKTITRTYQNGSGGTVAGRPTGYTFPNGSVAYTYDSAGRLSTVTDGTDTFNYGYTYTQATGGPRVGATTGNLKEDFMPYTLDGPRVDTTLEYDATRDALLSRANYLPSATLSKFSYAVNAIGQRTTLTPSGNAFTTITALNWGFDSLGQLTSANRGTASIFNRSYAYDDIGNRLAATHYNPTAVEDLTTSYYADKDENPLAGASALNQYARIIDPLLANPIDPVHDLDGNMTFGPVAGAGGLSIGMPAPAEAVLVWDAENRLIQATVDTIIVSYEYDHLGRLISRDDGTTVTRYLYDGFNRIAEYTGTTLAKVYLWGLDLSGTPQGAGGVGGLLSILDNASTIRYYPTYDGNGNVSEYINSTAGTQSAHFEYDPFGNLTVDSSTNAASFPYRFSTKPQDPVTGLYYYGYRYYDPLTGRWPTRDPIEEEGGINLYGFVGNDGVNAWDLLGHESNNDKKCRCIVGIVVELTSLTSDQPDLQDHKGGYNYKTGRVYSGTMAVSFNDDSIESWLIHDGGYRMSSSDVYGPRTSNPRGDDAVTPSGDGKVSTKQNDWGLFGFKITMKEMGSRGGILIHKSEGKVGTHGCIGVKFRTDDFIERMKEHYESKECKIKDVPIFILYSFRRRK